MQLIIGKHFMKELALNISDSFSFSSNCLFILVCLTLDMTKCLVSSQSVQFFLVCNISVAFFFNYFKLSNLSLTCINHVFSGLFSIWEDISPRSCLYSPCYACFILSRPRSVILPVWHFHVVNKIYVYWAQQQWCR